MQIEERTIVAGTGKRSGEGSEELAGHGIDGGGGGSFWCHRRRRTPRPVQRFISFFDDYNPF
jgi:hypothetical protein